MMNKDKSELMQFEGLCSELWQIQNCLDGVSTYIDQNKGKSLDSNWIQFVLSKQIEELKSLSEALEA